MNDVQTISNKENQQNSFNDLKKDEQNPEKKKYKIGEWEDIEEDLAIATLKRLREEKEKQRIPDWEDNDGDLLLEVLSELKTKEK